MVFHELINCPCSNTNHHTGGAMFTLSLRRLSDLRLHPEAINKKRCICHFSGFQQEVHLLTKFDINVYCVNSLCCRVMEASMYSNSLCRIMFFNEELTICDISSINMGQMIFFVVCFIKRCLKLGMHYEANLHVS